MLQLPLCELNATKALLITYKGLNFIVKQLTIEHQILCGQLD